MVTMNGRVVRSNSIPAGKFDWVSDQYLTGLSARQPVDRVDGRPNGKLKSPTGTVAAARIGNGRVLYP